MAGAAVVVLWSTTVLLKQMPVVAPLPYLNNNSRITEIVVSSPYSTDCPFQISIGTQADQYEGILPNYSFNFLNKNSETEVVSETNAPFVPANTIESLQLTGSNDANSKGQVNIEILGYQVTQ